MYASSVLDIEKIEHSADRARWFTLTLKLIRARLFAPLIKISLKQNLDKLADRIASVKLEKATKENLEQLYFIVNELLSICEKEKFYEVAVKYDQIEARLIEIQLSPTRGKRNEYTSLDEVMKDLDRHHGIKTKNVHG